MLSSEKSPHIPVLHRTGGSPAGKTVLGILQPKIGETVLDVTLGLGGHAKAFLEVVGERGKVIGLDADLDNVRQARERIGVHDNFIALHHNFRDVATLGEKVNVLFADLGVSSPHLDDPSRGFTFRASGPLDLRYDRTGGESAEALLSRLSEREITILLRDYGELRDAKRLACAMVNAAADGRMRTTDDLRACVEKTVGYRAPALLPQVFQAIRIAVNDELGALRSLLDSIPVLLLSGGRAGIISYHSLEDRLVKQAFRRLVTPEKDPLTGAVSRPARFALLTPKAIVPSTEEIVQNPRARSAKFRAIHRLD